jgi:hypothetical protein
MAITIARKLLTDSWTKNVDAVEAVVGRFRPGPAAKNECHVVFFEMATDVQLHVNVTHKYPTKSAPGWAGPAILPQGFVHNRRFSEGQSSGQIVRQVRDMILAAPR